MTPVVIDASAGVELVADTVRGRALRGLLPPDAAPLRDVQEAASHADPRTTMRYDRGRGSLDRHATYIVSTFLAGASR